MDNLDIGIGAEGQIRVFAADSTATVTEAVRRHKTSPTATAALGRLLTGTSLLAASLKEFDRVTVKIEADGPVKGIISESDNAGNLRGFVRNPLADAPVSDEGKLDVASVVGTGTFYVIRESGFDLGIKPAPYVGSVPMVSGEIAEDFAHYLLNSEQIPSAVLLGVLVNNQAPFVSAAGGVMIQMMPGANEHLVTMIEDTISRAPQLTTAINEGASTRDLISLVLGEIPYEILESRKIAFKCNCSADKAETLISGLGAEEVSSMISDDNGAVMNCGFCNEVYEIDEDRLSAILERLRNEE